MMLIQSIKRLIPARVRETLKGMWWNAPEHDPVEVRERFGRRWEVEQFTLHKRQVIIDGWVLVSPDQREHVRFTLNGQPFTRIVFPMTRPDVVVSHGWFPGSDQSGFSLRLELTDDPWNVPNPLTFEVTDARTGRSIHPNLQPYHRYILPPGEEILPDEMRRQRVHGQLDADSFRRIGEAVYGQLGVALRDALGTKFSDYGHILDWGCGSGRVTRYFRDRNPLTLTGVDVDADNLEWCKANLGHLASFETVPLHPPTQLPANTFDLSIGISIFTHLRESAQFEWLTELRRIMKPGGILLMTYHGPCEVINAKLNRKQRGRLDALGIVDYPNPLYDAKLAESDYYRNTFHTESYLRKHWGKYFEILQLMPCQIGPQDLAVLRKR